LEEEPNAGKLHVRFCEGSLKQKEEVEMASTRQEMEEMEPLECERHPDDYDCSFCFWYDGDRGICTWTNNGDEKGGEE